MKGYKKPLDEDDLYDTRKCDVSSILGDKLAKAWDEQLKFKKDPSLTLALIKVFKWDVITNGALFLLAELIK